MVPNWFDLRQNLLRCSISFAVVCYWLCACHSPVFEALKQPSEQRQARSEEESRIQGAFADLGLLVQPPNWKEKSPRYRCRTRHFEIRFTATDAALALDLASGADSIYERQKVWFEFGLPDRVTVKIEPAGSVYSNMMQHTDGRATGAHTFYLNAAKNPDRHTFAHELAHLFFLQMKRDRLLPWWLNEGIADYLATENRDNPGFAVQLLGQVGLQEELLQLGNLPASGIPQWQSYQAALSFFLFVHHQYGEEAVKSLIKNFLRAMPFIASEAVILPGHGKTLIDLETEWRGAAKEVASSN